MALLDQGASVAAIHNPCCLRAGQTVSHERLALVLARCSGWSARTEQRSPLIVPPVLEPPIRTNPRPAFQQHDLQNTGLKPSLWLGYRQQCARLTPATQLQHWPPVQRPAPELTPWPLPVCYFNPQDAFVLEPMGRQ